MIHHFGYESSHNIDIIHNIDTIQLPNLMQTKNIMTDFYLSKSIKNSKYLLDDFSFYWTQGDGSPLFINSSKYDINHDIGYKSFVFCPIPKNGCSAWKQVLRRIKGEKFYLADDYWSLHSQDNNLEQDRIHRFGVNGANKILYDKNIIHAVFIRDSIERCLSAFLDKCIQAHWSNKYWCIPRSDPNNSITHKIYTHFDLFIDSIVNKPQIHALDFHWLPQNFVCDLYKTVGRYHIYYTKDTNARYQFLFDIGGNKTWNKIGANGWVKKEKWRRRKLLSSRNLKNTKTIKKKPVKIMGKNATLQMMRLDLSGSFLDKQSYHTSNSSRKLFQFYRSDLLAKVIIFYESDYILFNQTLPQWICKFINVEDIIQLLKYKDFNEKAKNLEVLSYGEYSTYYKDYDHDAIVNDSDDDIIWTRNNEMKKRKQYFDTFIPQFYEMMEFDKEHETIIHKIRGMAVLSNILTFIDRNILPQCFRYQTDKKPWDWTNLLKREKNLIMSLMDNYFNIYLSDNKIKIPNLFLSKIETKNEEIINVEETFNKWRDEDIILYHNIGNTVIYMREIPRKTLFWSLYVKKKKNVK